MSLSEKLHSELALAMKAKQRTRVGVIRLIKAALKNKEIENGKSLSTEEENQVLQTMVKQRNEAMEQFEKEVAPISRRRRPRKRRSSRPICRTRSLRTRSSALPSRSSRSSVRARPRTWEAS